jgi:transposase
MYIRRTNIKSRAGAEPYFTYRLVESERIGDRVKQHILVNLGRHFDVPQDDWQALCARIEQLLDHQASILEIALPEPLERAAQRYAAQILAARSETLDETAVCFEEVDVDGLALVRPRSVGIEHLALHAAEQLGLHQVLEDLGFNRHQRAAALGNIIGRLCFPASESATHAWLQQRSALGELIGYDFEGMAAKRLYEASDLLWKHRQALEERLYKAEKTLFAFEETVTLYDLTNTYFEGVSHASSLSQQGHSKEKRSDAPLVTLGLVLDGSGFPRTSRIFPGNASEPQTLEVMLSGLQASPEAVVVLDAGLASEENIDWLRTEGYRYLVVSRKRSRHFEQADAVIVKQRPDQQVSIQRVVNPDTGEIELYCHSLAREQKERAIQHLFSERFEQQLHQLAEGLHKKGCVKRYGRVMERIGRLKQKFSRAAQHYRIEVDRDADGDRATAIHWRRQEKSGSQATHPGVYCLRTNIDTWDEVRLWQTYTLLTDLEAVFRSLKSELGLRPIYHQKTDRISGHLFISLLGYHLVHTLRVQLKAKGIHSSWELLRRSLATRMRITVSLRTRDGKTIHLRKSTRAEPHQQMIYDALGLPSQAGVNQRTTLKT